MPNYDSHPAGNFVWFELSTSDQAAATQFYSGLFGWEAQDSPMAPGMIYTTFRLNGRDAAGAYTMKPEDREMGVPPNWLVYISVPSADAAIAGALEHGGSAMSPAIDIPNVGRMAVLQDPVGAIFAVFEAGEHKGVGIYSEPGAFCWADLQTPDRERTAPFYRAMFGWQLLPGKDGDPNGYLHIKNGEQFIGGLPEARNLPPSVMPHWLPYIQCADCGAQTAKAEQLGARVIVAPMTIPGQLSFSVVADPQGAVFALFSPAH
jgi:predicted enzyme related to lactoylglutathione lyase